MKVSILIFLLSFVCVSCSTPIHEDATAVCDCYKELHRINPDNQSQMDFVADSCKKLHISVLQKFEENPENKIVFDKAYEHCQNEK